MKYTHALLVLLFSFISPCIYSDNSNYGLRFKSYDVLPQDRTGLILNAGNYIDVAEELTLDFDLKYEKGAILYGSTVKIIGESRSSITLGFSAGTNGRFPVIVINEEIIPIVTDIKWGEWFKVSITISNKDNRIGVRYNDFTKTIPSKNDWRKVIVSFGKTTLVNFQTEEVPPMVIRNIKLMHKDKLFRYWPLNKHNKSECYDEVKRSPAVAINPDWIIDSYATWAKKFHLSSKNHSYIQYAFDEVNGIIYFVADDRQIIAYHTATNTQDTIEVKSGRPASNNTNHLIFAPDRNELISYNLDEKTVSVFSFETGTWSNDKKATKEPAYWHHTSSYRTSHSSVVAFGGYGFYQYKNDLIEFDPHTNIWKSQSLSAISPRYSSASSIVDDTLYIFGGEGNLSGKQEIGSTVMSDFYAVDLNTKQVSRLWEAATPTRFLPCGNMIYNKEEDAFFVLAKSLGKQVLLKVSRLKPVIEELASIDSLALNADYNFYTLMKPRNEDKLYALFCRDYKKGNSEIDLYSISYSPMSLNEILQTPQSEKNLLIDWRWWLIGIVAMILIAGLIFYIKRRNSRSKFSTSNYLPEDHYTGNELLNDRKNIYYDRSSKAISLLGLFNVRDKEGNDITHMFTPILKNLVILIILRSGEGQGVNSRVVDNLLWPDKDDKSARNNRNVSMNRLNQVLEKIGNVQAVNNNGFWKISIEDDVVCDYLEVLKLSDMSKKTIMENKAAEAKLLELMEHGQLLPFTQEEWLDSKKAAYSDFATDFLLSILAREESVGNSHNILKIANLIFLFDSLNEEALSAKCKVHYALGKKSLAKNTYNSFCKEYETLLGEKYQIPLSKIVSG